MVAAGGSAPTGGRSEDACPYKSEKQAEVSGRIGIGEHRHRSETEVSMRKRKWRCQESLLSQAQWQRPDTVTQERCRCKR